MKDLELQDLVPADPLLREPGPPWWTWAIAGGIAVLVIVTLVLLLTRRSGPKPPPLPDPDAAFRTASEGLRQAASLPAREAATAASRVIRRYLAAACRDPSLYETHEEFLARHEALGGYPEETRGLASTLFTRLAELKYDKDRSGDTAEMTEACAHVLELLHQQRPA